MIVSMVKVHENEMTLVLKLGLLYLSNPNPRKAQQFIFTKCRIHKNRIVFQRKHRCAF